MAKHNLGMVTAYAYAVAGGYTGTEAEFEALLGNIATDLEEIENLTVTATTLPEGSSATASYSDGVLTLGIPKGDTGATGAGATATAGTTTTGAPGSDASVVNSGTTKDAVFDFTIPRGNTGNGIESITLTSTVGAVHTYTITFTDGNTTTFDVTDGEVTTAALTAILADYAKTDGAYESMTVGNAEQLISSVYVTDDEPYQFRTSGGSADIGDREFDTLVGGSVAWNQLADTQNGQNMAKQYLPMFNLGGTVGVVSGHKYLVSFVQPAGCAVYKQTGTRTGFPVTYKNYTAPSVATRQDFLVGATDTASYDMGNLISKLETTEESYHLSNQMLFDLTQMFGSTIADYIYSLEQATAGAGVAWFRKLFPKPYYAYNAGELMSVQAVSHDMVGFNAWDEEWENGYYSRDTGNKAGNSDTKYFRSKNYIPCLPSTGYYFKAPATHASNNTWYAVLFYDADKNFISARNDLATYPTKTTPANAYYMTFYVEVGTSGATYNNDICINLSWDGERNGEYEPYVEHSYPLDDSLTLRGRFEVENGKLKANGDTYISDGSVSRKWTTRNMSAFTTSHMSNLSVSDNTVRIYINMSSMKPTISTTEINILADKLNCYTPDYIVSNDVEGISENRNANDNGFWIRIAKSKLASNDYDGMVSYFASNPINVLFELKTPTTETADPFTNPQIVDDFGTEEYITTSIVPVGHYTQYMANLKAKLEMSPDSPSGAGDYIVRQTNGENEYVPLGSTNTISSIIARLEALENA